MPKMLKFKTSEPNDLQKEIKRLFEKLANTPEDSDEYNRVSDQLAKLYKLQEVDSKQKVSKDQWVASLASLAGILVIVAYEHGHVIASKAALSFVKK
ncbi:hypothetical protein SEA_FRODOSWAGGINS_30 [Streptomyces phage FrodoSwaggins]|uniref:Uncharacterized protein n=4 Tax=Rimavirus drgrey TaxID=2560783 RepID=A0A649VVB1_9CAUD|nr:hypothetical protein FDI43_gp30 [Streptomyces phage DrGrey]ASU03943.1 hypothetical protein SEA_DRGREY_30 [Streptomyces phage DrGrey]QAY17064.1 hypothetical protein SEA_POPY_30 [Streptomyces phage Popy]QEQ94643.1 hypothetical protein SEA_SOSHI_30 [Streptomyces phage Soshi]QGJ96570.1 hypothetical protein SEA_FRODOSWAGGINS_30 [Streptomyces phage FrodoSwaggins]